MGRIHRRWVVIGRGLFLGGIGVLLSCGGSSTATGSQLGLTPIGDKQVTIIDTNYHYQQLTFTVTATGMNGAAVSYAVAGQPPGSTLDTSTGLFSWTPTIADFGSHTVTFSAAAGGVTVHETMTIQVQNPTLPSGILFKMVSPNGGETYHYGDSVTCRWLEDITVCGNGMLSVVNGSLMSDYFANSNEYLKINRDTSAAAVAAGTRYFRIVDAQVAVAVCRILLVDKTVNGLAVTFGGNQMRLRCWDEYAPPGYTNNEDYSDSTFTVVQ